MTLDLAAIDRDLDALGAGLDVAARLTSLASAAPAPALDAIDAELTALADGVSLANGASPIGRLAAAPRVASAPAAAPRVASAPAAAPRVAGAPAAAPPVAAPPVAAPPVAAPLVAAPQVAAPAPIESLFGEEPPTAPLSASLFGDEAPTGLRIDVAEAELEAQAVENAAPLSEDALFGGESLQRERAAQLDGAAQGLDGLALDLDDPGQRVSVPDDLAALLEGEIDPSEFGPSSAAPLSSAADESGDPETVEVSVDDGELEMFVEDDELSAALEGSEPLPDVDTSPSIPPAHPDSVAPAERAGGESEPPEGQEKKGFFKKIFGK